MKEQRLEKRAAIRRLISNFGRPKAGLDPEKPLIRILGPGEFPIGTSQQKRIEFYFNSPEKTEESKEKKNGSNIDELIAEAELAKKERPRGISRCSGDENDEMHAKGKCVSRKCRVKGGGRQITNISQLPRISNILYHRSLRRRA